MKSSNLLEGTTWITLAEALMLPTGFLTLTFPTRQPETDGYGHFALQNILAGMGRFEASAIATAVR